MANTTVLRRLAIAKFVVVKTVANATVRRGPAPAEFVIIKRPAGASVPRALRDAIVRALAHIGVVGVRGTVMMIGAASHPPSSMSRWIIGSCVERMVQTGPARLALAPSATT